MQVAAAEHSKTELGVSQEVAIFAFSTTYVFRTAYVKQDLWLGDGVFVCLAASEGIGGWLSYSVDECAAV